MSLIAGKYNAGQALGNSLDSSKKKSQSTFSTDLLPYGLKKGRD
jgi:hypothetical protein